MKRNRGFWGDLEIYTWKTMDRVSPALAHFGMGMIGLVIISSITNIKSSVVGTRDPRDVVERAARAGDYERARKMFNVHKSLMTNSQMKQNFESGLEELVYPERVVEREIEKYEELLLTYPGSRDIYLLLAKLYREIGNNERSNEYTENARILDPNNEIFKSK